MHIPTIYNPKISDKDTIFALDTEKHHHLKNVLRIKDDTKVKISNGKGKIYTGNLSNKNISVESNEIFLRKSDLNIFIAIIQDKERLRFIIEKLTELSVNSISIGPTEHSQKLKINSEKLEKWSISAVEQSGNAFKPEIYLVDKLDYKKFKHAFDVSGENIKNNLDHKDIAIGPEGGWSNKEIENFKYVSKIADFTLRTETASILGVSLLM